MRRALPLLLLLLLPACGPGRLPPGDPTTPDVVLVSIDTLRADHLSSYGYPRPTTPFLDRLAAEGVRWTHARAPSPWTLPSHVTLMSGWFPHRHGIVEDDLAIPDGMPLLAEAMAARGFATGGIVSTLYVSDRYGFERGFDTFDAFDIRTSKENLSGEVTATDVVDRALAWLRSLPQGEPAFLFVHFYDVHYPYAPPKPYSTLFDRAPRRSDARYKRYAWYREHPLAPDQMAHQVAQYDEAIRYVDAELQRLHGAMQAAGRQATWAVTSDHGEELGERGAWGHAHTLFPEQLHVPLILSGARVPSGGVIEGTVGLEDLAPGLALLVGADLPPSGGLPLSVTGPTGFPNRLFPADTSRFDTNRVSLWQEGWRLDIDLATGARSLYDTTADPEERHDVALDEPRRAAIREQRLWGSRVTPWRCPEGCAVEARHGLIVVGSEIRGREATLERNQDFLLIPPDAEVRIAGSAQWFRAGERPPPPGTPLLWRGPDGTHAVTLSTEERARLEALGYLQPDGEEPAP
ncbi:MAG: sulfatase [Pseudomonadota bacterium]